MSHIPDPTRYIRSNHSLWAAWDIVVYVRWGILILIGIVTLLGG